MTTNLDLPPEAVRLARERICGAVNDGWSIKADDVAVILDELDRLRAERDAAWQAGAEAMREAAAFEAWERWNDADAECTPDYIADCIRALPIPDREGE